jgi:phosphoglycerol transferase MdoB-like AlkP superfamily enzyme
LVGDLLYYRGFQSFLSLHNLGETQNLDNLNGTVFAMIRPIDVVFLLENIFFIALVIYISQKYKLVSGGRWVFPLFFCVPIIIIFIMHLSMDFHDKDYSGKVLFQTQFVPYSTMRNLTPLGYHVYDTLEYIADNRPHKLSDSERNEINTWIDYKNEDLPSNEYFGKYKGKNLIFIQVESLENFVVNQKYNGQEITPRINKLLGNSLYFSNFYEQVNNGNSADADLMVNASVLPVRRGSTFFRFPNNDYTTLPDLLKTEDYTSKSLHSADGNIWNITRGFKTFGFDACLDIKDFKSGKIMNMGVTDESFLNDVSKMADKEKNPFYYYTVTVSSHVPFKMPDDMKGLKMDKTFDDTSMGSYFQAVNYADKQVGNFIDNLDKNGILDNSVVMIIGDHCGVHKYYDDEVEALKEKQPWWENETKVPLVIYSKNTKAQNIKTIGAEIDILPTIASLMGIDEEEYKNTTMGRNLLNTNKSYAILNDGSIIGKENLTDEDIQHIKKSFDIADLITETDYFSNSNKE